MIFSGGDISTALPTCQWTQSQLEADRRRHCHLWWGLNFCLIRVVTICNLFGTYAKFHTSTVFLLFVVNFCIISDLYHAIEQHPEHGDFTLAICPGCFFPLNWQTNTRPEGFLRVFFKMIIQTVFNITKRHRKQQRVCVHPSSGLQCPTAWIPGETCDEN